MAVTAVTAVVEITAVAEMEAVAETVEIMTDGQALLTLIPIDGRP